MVKEQYKCLKMGQELRKNLIDLKKELKDEAVKEDFLVLLQGDYSLFIGMMKDADPKVRKNAALILGRLGQDENVLPLFEAYKREQQLFVKSDYLKALFALDCSACREELAKRLAELEQYHPAEEEEKHIREELLALRKLADKGAVHKRHKFQGYGDTWEVILTTGKKYQQITAEQITEGKITILNRPPQIRSSNSHIPGIAVSIECKEGSGRF